MSGTEAKVGLKVMRARGSLNEGIVSGCSGSRRSEGSGTEGLSGQGTNLYSKGEDTACCMQKRAIWRA